MTDGDAIRIELNGEPREVPAGLTVSSLLAHLGLHPGMVVVERNREILRREGYGDTPVVAGDTLELVHFVGGGSPGGISMNWRYDGQRD